MKNPVQTPPCNLSKYFTLLQRPKIFALVLSLAGLPSLGLAQSTWNGSTSSDWNNAANWSAGVPSGVNAIINTNAPNICTISATPSATPVDIIIGGSGTTGRLDQTAGDLTTGAGNWLIVGLDSGTGFYNLSGGTLSAQDVHMARGGTTANATVNVTNAILNTAGAVVISDSYNASTASKGIMNVSSGGTVNCEGDLVLAYAGGASAYGQLNVNTGAVFNVATTTKRWFIVSYWDYLAGLVNMNGGTLNLNANTDIRFSVGWYGPGANTGNSIFNLNSGSVISWSGNQTGDGTGILDLNNNGGVVNNIFNLNGGTLAINQITANAVSGTAQFNFNGGTLKPTGTRTDFIKFNGSSQSANVMNGGAIIDTAGFDVGIPQGLVAGGTGGLTKTGLGTLTLAGTNTYTGSTVISNGTLALSGGATLVSQVVIPSGKTLDVSALTVAIQNPVSGVGSVTGSATAAAGMHIYPATDGTVGTLTFNNDLDMSAGGSVHLDLSTTYNSGNDQVAVTGNLTVSSATIIRIKALSGAANLSTVGDYVLCAAGGTLTLSSTPSLAWDGTVPANYLNYSLAQVGNTLVLKYTSSTAPTVTATASSTNLVRNQSFLLTATVTPGTGSVTNVVADASQIGGSSTASLILSATANVYTNTFVVASNTAPGAKTLTVVAKANSGLNSPGYGVNVTVLATNETWTGASANNLWSTKANWNNAAPAASGDAVTFAGSTRLSPDMDANYSVTGVTFASGASSFVLGSTGGNTLTLTANGILNLSANPQTVNVPLTLSGAQTLNASVGSLTISNTLDKAGNLLTVTGAASTAIKGSILNSGSLFKQGNGSLTIPGSATWDLTQASSGGFSGPLIAQAGTLAFNNGSVQTVNGELVIGGVIANGGAGNNAKIIVDNATMNVSSWLSVGRGNGVGGVSSDLVLTNGAIVTAQDTSAGFNGGNGANKPKGSITLSDTSSLTINNQFHVAEAGGANFTVNVNGTSTLSYGGFMDLCIGFGGTVANMNVNGGTVNCGGDPYIGHWGDGNATLNISSGSFNVGTTAEKWLFMGYWDYVNGTINVNGGSLNFWNNSKVRMARNVNNGGNTFAHVINQTGGDVTFFSDGGTTTGGSGLLDMEYVGAASGTSTYNLNGGVLTVPTIMSSATTGARIFNLNGGTLKAATDAVTLMDLGIGNAHAYVRTGGAIIDTDGKNVSIATALEHFSGDATDAGLVKKSTGTLTLNGTNSYTGNTIVQAGTLQLAQATLASSATVSVSNAAVLQLDFATTNQVFGLVLNGVAQAAGVYNSGNAPTYITGTGSLLVQPIASNPTNILFSVSGNTLSLSWPADHLGWILQSQTNSLSTGLGTNWVDVAGSASVTSTNMTVNPALPATFYRLRKP